MADISTYTVGTPKASDLLLGTEVADPNVEGDTNKTRNFTIQQVADLAKSVGTLGYTLYSALLTQTGTNAPTSIQLQNTIPGTMTLARTGAGVYTITNSGTPFTADKVQVFVNGGNNDGTVVRWTRTSTSIITILTGGADAKLVAGSIEIRVYS